MLLQPYRCRLSGSQTSPKTMPEEIEMKIIIGVDHDAYKKLNFLTIRTSLVRPALHTAAEPAVRAAVKT